MGRETILSDLSKLALLSHFPVLLSIDHLEPTMSGISYSAEAAQTLVAIYSTPDVVAQREATIRRLALKLGEQVIDVGCGPGFLCESMAADVGATGRVVGIELSEDLVRFATRRKGQPCIDYRLGDAARLDISSASFDVVVSTQVVEYVPNADAALHEMYRVLRPGGRGILVDTDWDTVIWHSRDEDRMARILKAWEDHCAHPRLTRTLAARLQASGFIVGCVEGYSIVNTVYDQSTYSHGLARLISEYLGKRNFDSQAIADWLADLSNLSQQNSYFFSINRYFFTVTKPTQG
jgi:arsenite methyltransferase